MENIICMKWGTKFGPAYVNRLAEMVRRFMSRPYQLVCFTDDARGIDPTVRIEPLPEMELDPRLPERGWRKLTVFQENLANLEGNALFLDLDIVVMGKLDDFFDVPGRFRIINDWNLNNYIGNSSVFRFEVGKMPGVLKYYLENTASVYANHRNEQAYLSWWMKEHGLLEYWKPEWCKSFKRNCLRSFPLGYILPPRHPGPDTRVLVFHGRPNPDEIVNGWHSPHFLRAARPVEWFQEVYR
ncbi:MAG: glycosyltransferase [Planctomycetia bacterium]|nr:glycosyltransferase [Planctomycetia bacterium]